MGVTVGVAVVVGVAVGVAVGGTHGSWYWNDVVVLQVLRTFVIRTTLAGPTFTRVPTGDPTGQSGLVRFG